MTRYRIVPITGRAACDWISKTHRHLDAPQGALFAAAVALDGEIVGVATAGNPPRVWLGTGRIVITRCAALDDLPSVGIHASPACSMLYGALCQASKSLGWKEAWTYTLPHEDWRSLRTAGFVFKGLTRAEQWHRPSRHRRAVATPVQKGRWMRELRSAA